MDIYIAYLLPRDASLAIYLADTDDLNVANHANTMLLDFRGCQC
jgi:hypothetical protein